MFIVLTDPDPGVVGVAVGHSITGVVTFTNVLSLIHTRHLVDDSMICALRLVRKHQSNLLLFGWKSHQICVTVYVTVYVTTHITAYVTAYVCLRMWLHMWLRMWPRMWLRMWLRMWQRMWLRMGLHTLLRMWLRMWLHTLLRMWLYLVNLVCACHEVIFSNGWILHCQRITLPSPEVKVFNTHFEFEYNWVLTTSQFGNCHCAELTIISNVPAHFRGSRFSGNFTSQLCSPILWYRVLRVTRIALVAHCNCRLLVCRIRLFTFYGIVFSI